MKLTMAGLHVELGEALQQHARTRMEDLANFMDGIVDAHLVLRQDSHHSHLHHAEVSAQVHGLRLAAEGQGIDHYAALDEAVSKLRRQMEKYKGRLLQRRARHAAFKEKAKDFISLDLEEAVLADAMDGADPTLAAVEAQYADYIPQVTKKEVSRIEAMQVDDAVMQMDLLHKPAFLFLNATTGQLNMVYRDGSNGVRWVAPKMDA